MASQGLDFAAVWTAAGVVVAFSVTAFIFRIGREAQLRSEGLRYWLPPADFVLLGSLVVALVGVFVLPVLGAGLAFARYALGWAFLLLAGYPFALAGHYEILLGKVPKETVDRRDEMTLEGTDWDYPWDSEQEKGVIKLIVAASAAYFAAVALREMA
jgi:hypothetical protein